MFVCFSGTWQTRFLSLAIGSDLLTFRAGKVFVEESTDVRALSFNNCGLWKVQRAAQIILQGSANFYASSKFSANLLKVIAKGHCTIAGHLSLENLLAYIRKDMITAPGARVNIAVGGTVAVGTFRNDSSWSLDGNLHLHVACFEQSEDALIFVKDTLTMTVYDESEERCQGRIVANCMMMNLPKKVRFDSYIRVNQIEIYVPHVNESRLTIGGQLEVLDGPLILKGRSSEVSSTSPLITVASSFVLHSYPAFVLEGQLKAEAVIAPFLAIQFSKSSYSLLSGMNSVTEVAPYRTLISCNSLHTERNSLIHSAPEDLFPEGILCAATWLHEGQIRFNGEKVYIITNGLVNSGRLTSGDKLQNHMREVSVLVGSFFRNDAVFSADRIEIRGNGQLQNTNRIFANDDINIKLANFRNEMGQTQLVGNHPKLLSARSNNQYTHLGVHIRGNSSTSKAHGPMNRHGSERQSWRNARSLLLIHNDMIYRHRNMILTAQDSILFKSRVIVDQLELTIGAAYSTELVVKSGASITTNQLRITGNCENLSVIIDGELSCKSMIVDARIRHVKVIGSGIFSCKKSSYVGVDSVILTTRDIRVTELTGSMVTIGSDDALHLSPFDSHLKTVSIYAGSCYLQGRIFVEREIILKITDGACHISGEIVGTRRSNELALECGDLILTGTVANLDFLECYTRLNLEHRETAVIKSVKNIVFEAKSISLKGKIMNSDSVIATGSEVKIEGFLQNHHHTNVLYSIFGKKILVDGAVCGVTRMELSGSEIIFSGIASNLKFLEIDANLAVLVPRGLKCEQFTAVAYSAIFDGNLDIAVLDVTVQLALFIKSDLNDCRQCRLIAAIILSLNCRVLSSKTDIFALIYAFEQFELLESPKQTVLPSMPDHSVNYKNEISSLQQISYNNSITAKRRILIEISFHPSAIIGHQGDLQREYDLLEKATKAVGDCFENLPVSSEKFEEALKKTNQMRSIDISLPTSSSFYQILSKLVNEMHINHQLISDSTELFHLICITPETGKCNKVIRSGMFIEERGRFVFLFNYLFKYLSIRYAFLRFFSPK